MQNSSGTKDNKLVNRGSERGAALITTLLISVLLLSAGGMLLLTTSMAGINTIDSATEMQAYYGAEAGIQATLNVLRGNVMPNPLFVANPPGGVAPENKIDFAKALDPSKSNLASDPTAPTFAKRLSRWLPYSYIPPAGAYADRVGVNQGYNPFNGIAYRVDLTDPDVTPLGRQPTRLVVSATGYGPRGARKTLSMLLTANSLDIEVPAPLVLRGHDDLVTNVNIDLGNSNAQTFSGVDNDGYEPDKPTLAINAHDVTTVQAAYASKPNTVANPKFQVLDLPSDPHPGGVKPPWFLKTADDARAFLAQAEVFANFCAAPGSPCIKRGVILTSLSGTAGSAAAPQFTIVKGDCHLDGGAGLLIVTGTLYFTGPGPKFDGVILVLGAGTLIKTGGGNRDVFGSIMVARFGATGGFLEPTFAYTNGSGSSNLQFDSRAVLEATPLAGPTVLGIAER